LSGKTLFGATSGGAGGFWGQGTVFRVNTDGKGFAVLHRFAPFNDAAHPTNSDGAYPAAGLILSGRTLYGTAAEGGNAGCGTIFKVNTDGTGLTVLHQFTAGGSNAPLNLDGARPMARLVLSGHTLYGTAQRGGNNEGTVFKVNTDGTGFATLHTFTRLGGRDLANRDGAFPQADLALLGNKLYGTAWGGGDGRHGTVFKLNTDGEGFIVLHSFTKGRGNDNGHISNADGAWPEAGLVTSGITLYGTTQEGGLPGNGTVFKLNTDGTGFGVLHSFTAHGHSYPAITNNDGESPQGLILSGHTLYGIASQYGNRFWGTVFKLNTDGTHFAVVHDFGGNDGSSPLANLVMSGDTLYGTANFGGGQGGGTVFKVKANGKGFAVLHRFTAEPLPPGMTD